MKRVIAGWVLAAVLAPLSGWAQTAVHRNAPVSAGERLPNLDKLKDELKLYHDCKHGCYAHDLDAQADRAVAFLKSRVAQKKPDEKLALVFDIDETALSNYPEMLKAGFAYDSNAFNAWVDSAQAAAIPGTLRIYKEARAGNVEVFFLTGRPEKEREATAQNLKAQGFDTWKDLLLRKADEATLTAAQYKSAERAKIAAGGYRIVLNVGDQWSDLKGAPEAEFSVKYPNPYYFIP